LRLLHLRERVKGRCMPRLKKQGIKVERNRVLEVMRENSLLPPHQSLYSGTALSVV